MRTMLPGPSVAMPLVYMVCLAAMACRGSTEPKEPPKRLSAACALRWKEFPPREWGMRQCGVGPRPDWSALYGVGARL